MISLLGEGVDGSMTWGWFQVLGGREERKRFWAFKI